MKILDTKVKKIVVSVLVVLMMIGYYTVHLKPKKEFSDNYYMPLKADVDMLNRKSNSLHFWLGRVDETIELRRKNRESRDLYQRFVNKRPPERYNLTVEQEVTLELVAELIELKSVVREQKSGVEYIICHIKDETGYGRNVEKLRSITLELAEMHLALIEYITKVGDNSTGEINKYDPLIVEDFIEQEKALMQQIEIEQKSMLIGGGEIVKGNDTVEQWKEKNKDLLLKAAACEIHLNSLADRQDFWKAQGGYKPEWIKKIDGVSDELIKKVRADKQANLETVDYQNKLVKALIGHKARLNAYKKMTLIDYADQYGVVFGDLYVPTAQENEIIFSGKYRF